MSKKLLFSYHEAAAILGYPSYNAVKLAVSRGKLKATRRPGDRRSFIPRSEILVAVGGSESMLAIFDGQRSA